MKKQNIINEINAGYIKFQKHPTAGLHIYNYSTIAQYERHWNETTLQCRGLILDENYEIVARPFAKFFNLGEMENQYIPNEPFEVYEKMDGSLGILYWLNDEPFIATRGSFISEQSVVATRILKTKYAAAIPKLQKGKTYLFEIIYPENRIVVDYGALEDLVLLAIVDNETGADEELQDIGFPIVKKYDGVKDIHALKALEEDNREGFIVKYKSGLRYKIKFEEYLRIHRIVTCVSSISIWEYLLAGDSFEAILDQVPDEFYNWVKAKQAEFKAQFEIIEKQCKSDFEVKETRKETAAYFNECQHPRVLFAMLDNKDYDAIIWRMLRPEFERPYTMRMKQVEEIGPT